MSFARHPVVHYALFLVICIGLAAAPVANHFKNPASNKDYPLWYATGRLVMSDTSLPNAFYADWPAWTLNGEPVTAAGPVYPTTPGIPFPFMYPPFAGALLGLLSELGRTGMFFVLVIGNVLSWAVVVELAIRFAAGTGNVSPWVRIIPSGMCLFFVSDMFLLGQPNLFLLALMMTGYWLLQRGREIPAGVLFAAAAGIKAFPALAIVYLVWRRQWKAAAAMLVALTVFLVLVPAPLRGFERNLSELKTWANGMLFNHSSDGVGQRPEQSQGWRNQSLLGVGHRLLRPVNSEADAFNAEIPPLYVNLFVLDYKSATLGIAAFAGLLGLGFVLVLPARRDRTRATDAVEFSMLGILIILGSPYAFTYFYVWMLFPITVLTYRGITDPAIAVRRVCWLTLGSLVVLFAAGVPYDGYRYGVAVGTFCWAGVLTVVALGWLLWREKRAAAAVAVMPFPVAARKVA